jgi:hypothetical protein
LGNEAEALETLRLNPGLINDPWVGEGFRISDGFLGAGWYVSQGDTAIIAASQGGSQGLVRELVRLGADVNARSNVNGWDAVMYASRYGHAAAVAVLLDNGADPNTQSKNCSALGGAAFYDHLPVCQLLLGRGADLLAVNACINYGGNDGNALEIYGLYSHPRLPPAILEERREALRVAFAEGPHESQVQRRRDERWARRWPFMLVLVGSGFRLLEARCLEMALRLLAVSEPSGGEAAGAPLTRRDECVRIVFRADNLVRLVVSFL